ncbi:TAXI family TRAP transporter solute-binding subunit [Undibacterium sp. RTI2.1]|uniref:TAXI family TRAP transporter solute-binding subunit n=1 Tax=unclassified Undibacterium TaxID=2630295 RepID=UPI002AB3D20A|nr:MULTISPECIES: TAXI family TRAP transporter solute-binding subunit [unclassified Undibacterium]MDY7538327.1 TAXI family TRAP transporter solute-binding subunit [Undibacterium sp. 5I1]MEB0031537.1 TAXI family TRAP transporter solute-binding subunit [Undibacterium sp. RTI2.1]MEB0115049.1 TAXI family TRAP transporter solute-binding subunit [Undibacterium sp. RTI2.2]MEB0229398.1 TAXI family TRAP transporter solute-binding subunit [Undibacterium sp. 10I3]MEB0256008.1 TAXI family TRAP transporter 
MQKIKFTLFSVRALLIAFGPMILAVLLVCGVGYWLVDPAPPRTIDFATGQENSPYQRFAKQYADELAKNDITIRFQATQGSQENLKLISDPDSEIELGFVQSGSTNEADALDKGLVSLGSLFYEPIWIFYRGTKEISTLNQFKGKHINVGPDGTGVARLFKQILSVNGMEATDVHLSSLEDTPATVALLDGTIDVLVFSSASDSPLLQMLLQTPGIQLFDFAQAEAYTRRFPFLSHVVLPRGIVDLGKNIPAKDYHLISPTATLVAHESLHPALISLLLQAAHKIHGGAGWFQKQGEFPSDKYIEIPVAEQAEKFYKNGPPFLQRYLSFWLANFVERMWVVIVALGALILPLSKIIPPLYVWRIRSRVYRWYGQLMMVEQAIDNVSPDQRQQVFSDQLKMLDEIEEKVNRISIPLSYAVELYGLRSHINFVRKRVEGLMTV